MTPDEQYAHNGKCRLLALEIANDIRPVKTYQNYSQRMLSGNDPKNLIQDADILYEWLVKMDQP